MSITVTNVQNRPYTISKGECIAHIIHQKMKNESLQTTLTVAQEVTTCDQDVTTRPPLKSEQNAPHVIQY